MSIKTIFAGAVLAALCFVTATPQAQAQTDRAPQAESAMAAAPDYAKLESWVCVPGKDTTCTTDLDTLVYLPNGEQHIEHVKAAVNPSIDCFYVYPTVSEEKTAYADMQETRNVQHVVRTQAAHLSSVCRVFAPIYRQSTLLHLKQRLGGGTIERETAPKDDIKAAWNYYLSHYNHGRGVVLVSHSQGTGMVLPLLTEDIDGKPAQSLLVAAFLAGAASVAVPPGQRVGGTFKHIPICSSASQVGCVYVWGTYADSDPVASQNFGRPRADGLKSACANPASVDSASGLTKFIRIRANDAPATDPPFTEFVDQVRGACKDLPAGNGFRVSALPGPHAKEIGEIFQGIQIKRPGWGLHGLDIQLIQGNMLSVIAAESATWQRSAGSPSKLAPQRNHP